MFLESELSMRVWNFFGSKYQIKASQSDFQSLIKHCCKGTNPKSLYAFSRISIVFIFSNTIWKHRNAIFLEESNLECNYALKSVLEKVRDFCNDFQPSVLDSPFESNCLYSISIIPKKLRIPTDMWVNGSLQNLAPLN